MESNQSNAAAVRAFRVLEEVARHRDGCALAAIVEAVGLPKQTVHRLVGQLQLAGLLVREPGTRRVQLAGRVEHFALGALRNGPERAERHAILSALVAEIGETCNLTLLDGTEVVYLDRVEAAWPLRLHFQTGSRVPAHCSASGKLLLALLPSRERKHILEALPFPYHTAHTITRRRDLEAALKRHAASRLLCLRGTRFAYAARQS